MSKMYSPWNIKHLIFFFFGFGFVFVCQKDVVTHARIKELAVQLMSDSNVKLFLENN